MKEASKEASHAIEVTASAVTAAPPAQLWELVCDTSRNPEWVEATAAVPRTDGPARLGSTYDEINPIMGPWRARTRWTVIEFDPRHRQVHRSEDVPFASESLVIIDVAPSGHGGEVRVTLRLSPSLGALGTSVLGLLKSKQRKGNERSVRKLAELAARGGLAAERRG
ncbi:MAG TPA: SRPBCC family protein [Streptosporangiaceae bacterium]|nr:SRPBCC family protein [Streptosporangiaceae bacterium]